MIFEIKDKHEEKPAAQTILVTAACMASARCGTVLELRPAMLIRLWKKDPLLTQSRLFMANNIWNSKENNVASQKEQNTNKIPLYRWCVCVVSY